jgi:hypothetical protein
MALLSMAATQARASADLEIFATIQPECSFTTVPGSYSAPITNSIQNIGDLGYTCNLPDGSTANFTLQTENGGLKNVATGTVVPYEVQWNLPPNDGSQAWQDAANFVSPVGFSWPASPAGTERKGLFRIRINAPLTGLPAGTYRDVVTYTISP